MSLITVSKQSFICAFLLFTFVSLIALSATDVLAGQDEFQIGDIVEFRFLGDTVQGEVIGFTGTGWPTIQFDHNGRSTERFYPPSRLTLVEAADDIAGGEDETTGKSEMRTWADTTGTFTIKAKLLSNKNGKIELEKEDGRVVTLPLIKLSEPDQAFIKNLEKQASIENPFAGGEMKAKPKSTVNNRARNRSPGRSPTASASSVNAIMPEANSNEIVLLDKGWNVEPDAAAMVATADKTIAINTEFTKHKFHNRRSGTSLSADKRFMATAISNPFENDSEIVVTDLEAGKSRPPLRIGLKEASILAISPDGTKAVTYKKGRGRDPGVMDFWTLGDQAKQTASWHTGSGFDRVGLAPVSGRFLDESRLLTFGRRVILWDCQTAAALYSFAILESTKPALSANGKQFAVASGKSVFIVNTNDGKVTGKIDPPSASQVLAFSQDGQFLAGIDSGTGEIWVWDLASNELARQLSAPPSSVKSMYWVGDKYLLINDTNLMDVELRTAVWKYRPSGGSIISANDGRFWFVGKSKMTPLSLPHKNFDDQTAQFDPDDLLVLKPGSEVSIQLDVPFAPSEQKAIRDKLVEMLQANEVAVRNDADLKLVLKITQGKQETAEMSSIMDPFGRRGTESIKYTPNIASVALTKDGVEFWGKGRRFGPGGIINMRSGESAQAAANRLCQPDAGFFKSIQMPKYISQFPNGKPLGESQINEQGVQ